MCPPFLRRAAAAALAAVLLLAPAACRGTSAKNADKTIAYHLDAEPETLDPQIAADAPAATAVQALFEGLVRLGADEQPRPGVAESWKPNGDSTGFTFTLRADAKWSDGTPVTAADFVFAFRRALDPSTGSSTCSQMFCIRNARAVHSGSLPPKELGVSADDSRTLSVELEYPVPEFPKLTAAAVYMPCNEKFFDSTQGRYGLDRDYLLGNGPFEIDGRYGWEHGQYLNLRRSSTYKGQNAPLPAAVNFSIGGKAADYADPVAALTSGKTDAAAVPFSRTDEARAAGCTLASFEDTTWGLCFNVQSPLFKNQKVRQAFLQAFSRKSVLSHLPKNASAAESIVLPSAEIDGKSYRAMAGGPFYLKQSPGAAQILAQGLQKLNLKLKDLSAVTVLCTDDASVKLMMNEMIAAWNGQFQNYFNMEPLSSEKLAGRIKSGNFSAALCPLTPSGGPFSAFAQFCSGAAGNPAKLADPAYDALVASAQQKSGAAAAAAYAEAEKYLGQRAVFYPLFYEKHYFACAKGVTGVVFHPYLGGVDFIRAGKE